jgi:small subunit ribosomal protein S1
VFEAEVVAVNKGGAIVQIEGLRAFLPGSHLCGGLPSDELIGTKLPLKFLEVRSRAYFACFTALHMTHVYT